MILYFTGTGNSAFIAKRIAEKTGDTAVDVFPMIRENDYGKLSSSRPFVVVCPTYGWQIPHVLGNWLKRTRLSGSRKLYFVMTCGDGIGNAGGYAKRFCEKKGMEYMGCGKVVMPENYVAMFPVPDRTEAERIIGKAIPQADQIAEHIRKGNPLPKAEISLLDRFLSTVVNPVFYKLFVHAGKFRTTERCTGCGACVRLCPLSIVEGAMAAAEFLGCAEPKLGNGGSTNCNRALEAGLPAVCLGGGCDYDCQCHTLDEQFKVEDAFKGCQQTLLMTLLCAGTEMTESII